MSGNGNFTEAEKDFLHKLNKKYRKSDGSLSAAAQYVVKAVKNEFLQSRGTSTVERIDYVINEALIQLKNASDISSVDMVKLGEAQKTFKTLTDSGKIVLQTMWDADDKVKLGDNANWLADSTAQAVQQEATKSYFERMSAASDKVIELGKKLENTNKKWLAEVTEIDAPNVVKMAEQAHFPHKPSHRK